MEKPNKDNLTVIYYTSNYLEEKNPFFIENTKAQLLKAVDDLPIVSVSQKPMDLGFNVNIGMVGRSHLNIYKQILIGAKNAKTKYVATAEDDILYSWEHYHTKLPSTDVFLYDMNRVSIFTWSKPPMFSYRHKRTVVNQLIAPRLMLIEALEERFAKLEKFPGIPLKYWGDPGRYEAFLGVTVRPVDTFMSTRSSIVFSHEFAYGYEYNQGKKKRLGDLRILELEGWGKPQDVLKLFYKNYEG